MNDINVNFKILGIEPGTPEDKIKQTYRNAAKVWHIDRFESDLCLRQKAEEKLKEINNSYSAIKHFIKGKVSSADNFEVVSCINKSKINESTN